MNEERDSHGIADWKHACQQIENQLESLEIKSRKLDGIHATLMVNFGLNSRPNPDGIVVGHQCETHDALMSVLTQYTNKLSQANAKIAEIRKAIEAIVCTDEVDAGVILLSSESPYHYDKRGKGMVYDKEHFSDLGDAMIKLWEITK